MSILQCLNGRCSCVGYRCRFVWRPCVNWNYWFFKKCIYLCKSLPQETMFTVGFKSFKRLEGLFMQKDSNRLCMYNHHWETKPCSCFSVSLKIVSGRKTNTSNKSFGVACLVPPLPSPFAVWAARFSLSSISLHLLPQMWVESVARPLLSHRENQGSEPSSSSTLVWNAAKFSEAAATHPVQHLQAVQRLHPAPWRGTEVWASLVVGKIRCWNEWNWLCDLCIYVKTRTSAMINVWAIYVKNSLTLQGLRPITALYILFHNVCKIFARCLFYLWC